MVKFMCTSGRPLETIWNQSVFLWLLLMVYRFLRECSKMCSFYWLDGCRILRCRRALKMVRKPEFDLSNQYVELRTFRHLVSYPSYGYSSSACCLRSDLAAVKLSLPSMKPSISAIIYA